MNGFEDINRIPLDLENGDIRYEVKNGKLTLFVKKRPPSIDIRDLFSTEEWKALLRHQFVLGAWNAGTNYLAGNIVTYEGCLWQSIKDNNLAHEPGKNSIWWLKLVEKGADGITPDEIFKILGTEDFHMTITDDHNGIVWASADGNQEITLKAKVNLFFRDITDHVLHWVWTRQSGGTNPSFDDMASDEEWNNRYKTINSPSIIVLEKDIRFPSTRFICEATIDNRKIKQVLDIEL